MFMYGDALIDSLMWFFPNLAVVFSTWRNPSRHYLFLNWFLFSTYMAMALYKDVHVLLLTPGTERFANESCSGVMFDLLALAAFFAIRHCKAGIAKAAEVDPASAK